MEETPGYVTEGINALDELINRTIYGVKEDTRYGRKYLPYDKFATANTGYEHELPGAPFTMRAYAWADCISESEDVWLEYCSEEGCVACEPNFYHAESGFKAYWYKHSERGEECNFAPNHDQWREIYRQCEDWILAQGNKEDQ